MDLTNPALMDYLAGAILANGFVWIWSMALGYLQNVLSSETTFILGFVSYIVFIVGGVVASFVVCIKASQKHLMVGLKLAVFSWIFSIILTPTANAELSISFLIALLICFTIGGIAGAYLALKSNLRNSLVETLNDVSDP